MLNTLIALALASAMIAPAAQAQLHDGKPINAADAEKMAAACKSLAVKFGWTMQIAILNEYGDLIRFEKMDGARRATGTFALEKARSSFRTGRTTRELGKMGDSSLQAFQAISIPGGIPMMIGDRLVAVVGVSGSAPENDELCSLAAIAAGGGKAPEKPY